jgi:hypothetical protein
MRRAELEERRAGRPEAEKPPQVQETPYLQRLAWASAVGSHAIQRMAEEHAEQEVDAEAAEGEAEDVEAAEGEDTPSDGMAWLPEGLEGATEAMATTPDGAEAAEEAEPSAESGAVLARQPTKTKPKPRTAKGPAPTNGDAADVARVGKRVLGQIPQLERERVISTVYAEELTRRIEWFIDRAKQRRPGEQAQIRKDLRTLRGHPDELRKQAAESRSTKGKTLISDFKVTPPVIRVGEGEAARISFVLGNNVKSVTAMIMVHERGPGDDREADRTWMRTFSIDPRPGYHQAIWDGTFKGMANEPPKTGTYTLEIAVDGEKHREHLTERIRIENPNDETVLPRLESGREISTFTFDGKTLVLTDSGGDTIESPATSGMKPHNPRNSEKKDYTDPKHQWVASRGPIPAGNYVLKPGHYQVPDADKKGETYASGGTAAKWGPMRVQIEPNVVKNRSEFFLHMDVMNDGTAGCIGIPPAYEGKFNQMMSLIARSKKDIKLTVSY